jgi:sulfatase maturation enzyme AslB (radical SAM superfamily)
MVVPTFKYGAIFGQENIPRVRDIVLSNREPEKLSRIPPSFIVMDITWQCNYHCGCCIDREAINKDSKNLKVELIEDIFDYSRNHKVRGIMTMGGEVFLYRAGMQIALEKSIIYKIPLKTVSNGSHLKEYIPLLVNAYKIPGSMLRVSINSDKEHYRAQTNGDFDLEEVLDSIKTITSQGTPMYVSTVVYPQSSEKDGTIPNVSSLHKIIKYCEDAGVKTQILLPARDPLTRKRYSRDDNERKIMYEILRKKKEGGYKLELGTDDFSEKIFPCTQNLSFNPCCPSGFLFTLVGSDGRVYKCTDNRGKDAMVIGKIENPGDFEKFWHSEERVNKQICTNCQNQGCARYEVNSLLDSCCETYCKRGIDLSEYLEIRGFEDSIFI